MTGLAALLCAGLSAAGLLQACAGAAAVHRFRRRPGPGAGALPPLTVLKPLHGDEPVLEQALASFCAQDYPGLQIVFGVQHPGDPALAVVTRLRTRFPDMDVAVVVDATVHGSNRKIGNLINMLRAARHEVLVIADSDIHAPPGYLRSVAAALNGPGVGLVTTLYVGLAAAPNLVGQLGAAYVNHDFLPGALLARALGRQDCLGATMALTRTTLEAIGGLRALADHVADDALLGELVRRQGRSVALAGTIPATTVAETRLADLFAHELRWMRTMRAVAPAGFAFSAVQFPLFWAALTVVLAGGAGWAWSGFAVAWMLRSVLARQVDRALRVVSPLPIWCLPLRDLLSVAVMLSSYRSNRVRWRGREHRVIRLSRAGLQPGEG